MIYFARSTNGGAIKIRFSGNVRTRFAGLRCEAKQPIQILAVMEGGTLEEYHLHQRFLAHRVIGEWFRAVPELLEFIDREGKPWSGQSDVDANQHLGCRPVYSAVLDDDHPADGEVLSRNLKRLGYVVTKVDVDRVADLITEKTGKWMNRQKVVNLLNAINISPETIKMITEGLGVKPEELTRRIKR